MKKMHQTSDAYDALVDWLRGAKPGDRHEYHRGDICRALHVADPDVRLSAAQVEISQVRRLAWLMHENGRVHLVQKRHGPFDYSYLAVARPVRGALPDAFAKPLAA